MVLSDVGVSRLVYKTMAETLQAARARIGISTAIDAVALAVAILLLLQLAIQLLPLQLLVGAVAVLLPVEISAALALLQTPIEIALAIFRLRDRLGHAERADRQGGRHSHKGGAEQGSAVHHSDNVDPHAGFLKAQKREGIEGDSGPKKKRPRLGPLP